MTDIKSDRIEAVTPGAILQMIPDEMGNPRGVVTIRRYNKEKGETETLIVHEGDYVQVRLPGHNLDINVGMILELLYVKDPELGKYVGFRGDFTPDRHVYSEIESSLLSKHNSVCLQNPVGDILMVLTEAEYNERAGIIIPPGADQTL